MIKAFKSNFKRLALPALMIGAAVLPLQADSLIKKNQKSMFADRKAIEIGDIITVLVQENTTSSKDNSLSTTKNSDLNAALQTLLFSPNASKLATHNGELPALAFNSSSSFDGGGSVSNSEKITARIAVSVVDSLPNDTLLIEGKRQTKINGETQDMILRGIVRAEDVAANNTVYSYNIANGEIQIESQGALRDSGRPGWFKRFWDKVTPF